MWVLAVPQIADFFEREIDAVLATVVVMAIFVGHPFVGHRFSGADALRGGAAGSSLETIAVNGHGRERRRDRGVVRRGVRERLAHQIEAKADARRVVDRLQQPRVIRRIDDDQHAAEILGGRAHERRTADVDLLDERVERRRGIGRRLHERIQVHDDDVDEADAKARQGGEIVGTVAARENAAVQRRMQRLHAAVHHFREPGEIRHACHGEAGVGQRPRRAAGRHELVAARGEPASDLDDSGLVRHAQQCSWHKTKSPVSSLPTPGGPGAVRERPHTRGLFFWSLILFNDAVRVTASRKKNDAYHRQGQVVQQRQGLWVHRA